MDDDQNFDYLREYLEQEECPECEGTLLYDEDDDTHLCVVCAWSTAPDGLEGEDALFV